MLLHCANSFVYSRAITAPGAVTSSNSSRNVYPANEVRGYPLVSGLKQVDSELISENSLNDKALQIQKKGNEDMINGVDHAIVRAPVSLDNGGLIHREALLDRMGYLLLNHIA